MEKETASAYVLGAVDAAKGLYPVFVCEAHKLRFKDHVSPSALAWAGIAVYEAIAPPDQLLSESADRMLVKHPILTRAAIGITALHLANAFEDTGLQRYDPIHRTTLALRRIKYF